MRHAEFIDAIAARLVIPANITHVLPAAFEMVHVMAELAATKHIDIFIFHSSTMCYIMDPTPLPRELFRHGIEQERIMILRVGEQGVTNVEFAKSLDKIQCLRISEIKADDAAIREFMPSDTAQHRVAGHQPLQKRD